MFVFARLTPQLALLFLLILFLLILYSLLHNFVGALSVAESCLMWPKLYKRYIDIFALFSFMIEVFLALLEVYNALLIDLYSL